MYNIFFKVLIIALIVSTLGILGLKPKMHKRIFVIDSSYSIVEEPSDDEEESIILEQTTVEVVENKVSDNKKVETKEKQVSPKKVVSKTQTAPKKVETKKIEPKENTVKTVQKAQSEPKKQEVKVVKTPETVKQETPKQVQTKTPETVKQETPKQVQTKTQPKQTVLTEQEEEIAWNIWRSNLQNQIMRDTKLPYIPKGTIFKFSFDVDKYGRITNIKTYSKNPNYTPYAIQYIAPVIRSYQGKDILDFPKGTQRLTTKFEGGWKISDSAKYSTPDDYNDIEKVKK